MGAGQPLNTTNGATPVSAVLIVDRIELFDQWRAMYHATAAGGGPYKGATEVTFVADKDAHRIGDQVHATIGPITLTMVAAEWGMDPEQPSTIV
jgi:hypothetical protein